MDGELENIGQLGIKIDEFFNSETIRSSISSKLQKGIWHFDIRFEEISGFDLGLGNYLLDSPEDALKYMEHCMNTMDFSMSHPELTIRVYNLPQCQKRTPWKFRSEDVGRFIALTGVINKSSPLIHQCKAAIFTCPSCGEEYPVMMRDDVFKEPSTCRCGRKGKMVEIAEKRVMNDIFKIGICDDLSTDENTNRAVAREKIAILDNQLASKEIDNQIKIGRRVVANGYFKYVQKARTTEFESVFYINCIEFIEVGWDTVKITEPEAERIEQLAKEENIISRLAESVVDVYGMDHIKQTCLLVLAGAPHKYDANGHLASRGTIHYLTIGNPGSGKSFMFKRFASISPINAAQPAQNASGKGLVVSVNQDKEMGSWAAYPGVVAMAHKGVVFIDEIDKTNPEDYADHNGAMDEMVVNVAKANIKAKIETETSYLATANPENRVFVPGISFYNQINMPKDFIDRFDMIHPSKLSDNEMERNKVVEVMLERHLSTDEREGWKPEFAHEFITKYIAYCRRNNPCPILARELFDYIKKKLNELMRPSADSNAHISFRQLESIIRLSYASARLRLRDVTREDLDLAFELKRISFVDLEIIDDRGNFSWSKLENVSEKNISDKQVFFDLLEEFGMNTPLIDITSLVRRCVEKGLAETKVEEWIEAVKKKGDYFEPRYGFLQRI